MSLLVTSTGLSVQSSVQSALESSSRRVVSGNVALALGKSLLNIVLTPIHNFGLACKEVASLNISKAVSHLGRAIGDSIRSTLLSVVLLVTFVASLLFKAKAPAIVFDGIHQLQLKKYETILTQYATLLNKDDGSNLDPLISEVKNFSHIPIAKPLLECLVCLQNQENPRESYQKFVAKLDEIATLIIENKLNESSSRKTLRCIEIAETLAINRWSGVNMEGHFIERIDLAAGKPLRPETLAKLPDSMREINTAIAHSSPHARKSWLALNWQKLQGTAGTMNFTKGQNTPDRLATLTYNTSGGPSREVTYLRHGSPTHGKDHPWAKDSEGIVPNYELFISAAAKRGQGVFYVVHQRLQGGGFDDESSRTKAILALQARHPNFHAMVQPVEGNFFNQKGVYAGATTFRELKGALIHEFFGNKKDPTCALPSRLPDHYTQTFPEIFDTVHNIFFNGKTNLSEGDWQKFILFFYAFQRMDLKASLGEASHPISYYVTACKDDLDRGGGQALLELVLHLIKTGQADNKAQLSHLINHLLGPPIVVKQKEMLSSRLEQVLPAIEYLTDNPNILARLQAHDFSGHAPTAVTF